jgi:hypothetical protein
MADYFFQTIIQPDIPRTAMTVLEYRILGEMFEEELVGEDVYFFASHGPNDFIFIEAADAQRLLEEGDGIPSSIADLVRKELADRDPAETELELDMSMIGYEAIFQDIIRRSALDYVQVMAAWTCSKMRPDGFGGLASLITADAVESMTTADFLGEAIARLEVDSGSR